MKAILKYFNVDGVLFPFATNKEFSKGDKVKVNNLGRNFIDGVVVEVAENLLEIDLGWTSTQTKTSADCYKILGRMTPESSKMLQSMYYHDEMGIEVEEKLLDYGFAGKSPSGLYKVKCICCNDFK